MLIVASVPVRTVLGIDTALPIAVVALPSPFGVVRFFPCPTVVPIWALA